MKTLFLFLLTATTVLAQIRTDAGLTAYWQTNAANQAVLMVVGPPTNHMAWSVRGHAFVVTNATGAESAPAAPPPVTPIDPTTDASLTVWLHGTNLAAMTPDDPIMTWTDSSGSGLGHNFVSNSYNPPHVYASPVGAAALFDRSGAGQGLGGNYTEWMNYSGTNEGTLIFLVGGTFPTGGNQALFAVQGPGDAWHVSCFMPYDGAFVFDWGDATGGRVAVTNTAALYAISTNDISAVVMRRFTNGTQSIRIRGVDIASTNSATGLAVRTHQVRPLLGRLYGNILPWGGYMRDFLLFSRGLTDEEADGYAQFCEDLTDP